MSNTIPHSLRNDYWACRQVMRKASSNYWTATRVCPKNKIHHIEAIYAVLRIGDDLVDNINIKTRSRRESIELWRDQYWSAFNKGFSKNAVLRAFLHTSHTFSIPPQLLEPFFSSMIADTEKSQYSSFEELMMYMEGSAFPAGRLFSYVFGTKSNYVPDAFPISDALAVAMQLTNFIRDIEEDLSRGRVYFPSSELERFNCKINNTADLMNNESFTLFLKYQIDRAMGYYNIAEANIKNTWSTSHWAIMGALYIYRYILFDIMNNDYQVHSRRAGASTSKKLYLLGKAWLAVNARP